MSIDWSILHWVRDVLTWLFSASSASFAVLFCILYRHLPLRKRSAPPDPAALRPSARRPV